MAITDAQFSAWLARDKERTILCELKHAYESGGAPVEGTVYFSNRPYRTKPTDSPPNRPYRSLIRSIPRIGRGVDPDALGGNGDVSVGQLELDNTDGSIDFMLDLIIDGREAAFYFGSRSWARSDFRLMQLMLQEVASGSDDETIAIVLRDKRLLLDREIAGDVVNDERRKPLVFTFDSPTATTASSIEPVVKDATNLEYYALQNYVNGSVAGITDNGIDVSAETLRFVTNAALTANAGTDTLSLTVAHGFAVNRVVTFGGSSIFAGLVNGLQYWVIAAGLTATDFRVSTTRGGAAADITGTTFAGTVGLTDKGYYDRMSVDGTVQLSAAPAGRLLCDVIGYSPTQSTDHFSGGPGELLRALLIDYGGVTAAEVDAATFTSIYNDLTSTIQGTARAVMDRENLLDVLQDVARVAQIYFVPDNEGVYHAFRLDLSSLQSRTAAWTLTEGDVLKPPDIENARVINGTIAVNSRRNYRPLTFGEFASAVSTVSRQLLSGQYQKSATNTAPSGTSFATNWQGFFKTARRTEVAGAFAQTGASLIAIADEMLADSVPHIKLIKVPTDLRPYEWRIGDVVNFTYPRYGFEAGYNCRVVDIELDPTNDSSELVLITRMAPDYTTASH